MGSVGFRPVIFASTQREVSVLKTRYRVDVSLGLRAAVSAEVAVREKGICNLSYLRCESSRSSLSMVYRKLIAMQYCKAGFESRLALLTG